MLRESLRRGVSAKPTMADTKLELVVDVTAALGVPGTNKDMPRDWVGMCANEWLR